MPDTSQPYGYIEMEIERCKYEAKVAQDESRKQAVIAEVHLRNASELELSLKKQKEADSERN